MTLRVRASIVHSRGITMIELTVLAPMKDSLVRLKHQRLRASAPQSRCARQLPYRRGAG
jgi:hypothetical protein